MSVFGEKFKTHHYDKTCFEGIYQIPDQMIKEVRMVLRSRLIRHIKHRLADEKRRLILHRDKSWRFKTLCGMTY